MLTIHEDNLGFAVESVRSIAAVVDKASFVAEASSVDYTVLVEVEEEGEKFAVVDYATAVGFFRGDILRNN